MLKPGKIAPSNPALPARESTQRNAAIARWKNKIAAHAPLRGVAVDSQFAAARADRGGADFIVVNNTGKFRAAGFGLVASLMPYDDANATVLALAPGVIPEVKRAPILAGLCGVDPFRMPRTLLAEALRAGYAGVQNFPSVGFLDGRFRRQLERCELGFAHEVELVRLAHELGLLCVPLVFGPEEALDMARAGADALVFHRGLAVPGEAVDSRANAEAFRATLAPALDLCPGLVLLNQSAGAAGDETFLSCLEGRFPCHGIFADGEA